jgi:chromosome segregation ATPase
VTDREIGVLLRELAQMREEFRTYRHEHRSEMAAMAAEHKAEIEELYRELAARTQLLERALDELRLRDRDHDELIDTGRHEIAQTQRLLDMHAAELTRTKMRVGLVVALVAAPGGAGVVELIKALIGTLQ